MRIWLIIASVIVFSTGCILDPPETEDEAPTADSDEENVQVAEDAGIPDAPEVRDGRFDGGAPSPTVDAGPPADTGQDENGRPHGAEPSEDAGFEASDSDAALDNGRDVG